MNNPDYIRALYAISPIFFWPVVWLRIFMLRRTIERLGAQGFTSIGYVWDPEALCFRISRLDKDDPPDPLAACAPRTNFIYALAGMMPETLWAIVFNRALAIQDDARMQRYSRSFAPPLLDPG